MPTTLLIAMIAGSASALMSVAAITQSPIAMLLSLIATLPIMVAALGWGSLSAVLAGVVGSTVLGALGGIPLGLAFALSIAAPACWLTHLILLAQPKSEPVASFDPSDSLDWYPTGRLLLWIAAFGCVTGALTTSADTQAAIRTMVNTALKAAAQRNAIGDDTIQRLTDLFVMMAPVTTTILTMLMLSLNVWLAARIAKMSGRLRRPWPDLRSTELPKSVSIAAIAALALSFAGDIVGVFAQIVTGALITVFTLTGFAVLHTVTQNMQSRAVWLTAAYASVFVIGWPVLAVAALGLTDSMIGFRQRINAGRPPASQQPRS